MRHTLSVLVEDKPGVLARVSSLLARRGFNIHSLTVGPSHEPGLSRMTIVVDATELEQVKKQLHKLVNVVKISEMEDRQSLERELMLVRVNAQPARRAELLSLAAVFDAAPVDVGPASIAFQIVGKPHKVNDFLELVRPYGVIDLVKSGWVAMARETKTRGASLRAVK
ncbi:MAG TPA: acetolactate synthase small subunit [Acidimicrobiia bacterium]|nr:acetolactate synthase small subunit [Acidimicrobiia bacterium]